MSDLLSFYEGTFQRIIPLENAVHSTVRGCLLECKRLVRDALLFFKKGIYTYTHTYIHTYSMCLYFITYIDVRDGYMRFSKAFDTYPDGPPFNKIYVHKYTHTYIHAYMYKI